MSKHAMILGELACENLKNCAVRLALWQNLPRLAPATDAEALRFLDMHELMGKGIGLINVYLLSAVALALDVQRWTRDNHLAEIVTCLRLAYPEP